MWLEEELQNVGGGPRPPRRRVMAGLAFPVVAGTAVGLTVPAAPAWFWGAGILLLLPLFVWVRRTWSVVPLMAAVFFLVAAHARQSVGVRTATSLPVLIERSMEYVQFVAVAREDAAPREGDAVFRARIEGLNREGIWRRADDRVRIVIRGGAASGCLPRYGERWRLRGIVQPAVPRQSGLFTLPENQAVVDSDRAVFLDRGRGQPLVDWCMRQRRACHAILGRGLEDFPDLRGLVQSLMLGYREDLPPLLQKDFKATGTVHIFAISGSHVAMVTVLIAGLLRALGIPWTQWFPVLAPLLVIYTILTGAATSAVRSCVMAILMLAAPFLGRKPDAVSALAVAAMVILLAAPAQLGDLGFLLSFTAVAGLLAIPPVLDGWARRLFRRDDWQLPAGEAGPRRRGRETALFAARYGIVTVSAWIATSPLTAYFFNLFSPAALPMNLLVIPAAFVILLAGVMSLVCAPFGIFFSEVFNHAARVVAAGLTACIQWAANVPGGHWFVRTPPAAGVIAWYAILAVAAVMARRLRAALPAGLAVLTALALAWGVREAQRCRVSVLDVGEGNSVLVKARTAHILVDTGPEFRADRTLQQLRGEGVDRLDALALSHSDAQHMGAARYLLRELPVAELWVPAVLWPSPLMTETIRLAEAAGVPVRRLQAGDQGDWPGALFWEVLWPPAEMKMTCADDAALVLRVARGGVSVLLAGDIGAAQEQALVVRESSLAAAVLVTGRHGDAGATSTAWLKAVRPREAIISSGPHPDGRHPDAETLVRLADRGIAVWRTDRQGSIHVEMESRVCPWPEPNYRMDTRR